MGEIGLDRANLPSTDWATRLPRERCTLMAEARRMIAGRAESLIAEATSVRCVHAADVLAAEIIPLCEGLRFLGTRGPRLLCDRRQGWRGRPLWLWGVRAVVSRVPHGRVLVIGPWNYPLFLPGIQVAQALAAGNEVYWKPAPGCEMLTTRLAECFWDAGVPQAGLRVLPSDVESTTRLIEAGVDLIVLTGSHATGVKVLELAASQVTPCIVELSGCDAMVVLDDADLERAARCLAFGLSFNQGATCMAPRRVFVAERIAADFIHKLSDSPRMQGTALRVHPAALSSVVSAVETTLQQGARDALGRFDLEALRSHGMMPPTLLVDVPAKAPTMCEDIFAPLASLRKFQPQESVVELVNHCRYRLTASLFGSQRRCEQLAQEMNVGTVVINDIIAPTADPRLPFGGRGESGFGVTRGEEGLLAMTVPKTICMRRGGPLPHLDPPDDSVTEILSGALKLNHLSSLQSRFGGLRQLMRGIRLNRSSRN